MSDRFDELRTFVTVLSAGGVSAAAAELGIAKSAVSRRMSDLERRLGVQLLARKGKRLEVTEIGTAYAARARSILTDLENLESFLDPAPSVAPTTISISAASDVTIHVLIPALAELASDLAADGILLRLVDDRDHAHDLSVVTTEPTSSDGRTLLMGRMTTCVSPVHLAAHGGNARRGGRRVIVIEDETHGGETQSDEEADASSTTIVVSDAVSAVQAAVVGLGMVRLPDYAIGPHLAEGRLKTLIADEKPSFRLALRFDERGPAQLLSLVDRLVEAVASGIDVVNRRSRT